MIKKSLTVMLMLMWFSLPVEAISKYSGTSNFQFLKIPPSARAVGLGEAYTAVSDDLEALIYNPAGLAQLTREQMSTTYLQWLKDIWCGYFNYGKPLPQKGTIAASIFYLTAIDIEKRGEDKSLLGNLSVNNGVATVGFGRELSEKILGGASVKIAFESYDNKGWTAGAIDLGLLLRFYPRFNVGISLLNLSFFGTNLPFGQRLGLAYQVHRKVRFAMDLYGYRDSGLRFGGGLEYKYNRNLSLRLGYKGFEDNLGRVEAKVLESIGMDEVPGLSLGVGILTTQGLKGHAMKFDYGFVPYGRLGMTHHFSLGFEF